MHELSLAHSIGEIAAATGREQASGGRGRVRSVRVRIGDLAGVEPESLTFCFEVVRGEWPETEDAALEIVRCPARVRCISCGREADLEGLGAACPNCGEARRDLVSGRELEVIGVEVLIDEPPGGSEGGRT